MARLRRAALVAVLALAWPGWLRAQVGTTTDLLTGVVKDSAGKPIVDAIVEATSHDNSKSDGDQAEGSAEDIVYGQREGISLADAIMWANSLPGGVTLYLYDEGGGTARSSLRN